MTYSISKEFEFSASHVLNGLPDGHQCGRLHGHNYRVRVELVAGGLDARGFVLDYGDLAGFKRWLDDTVDHRHLNDVGPFRGPHGDNPTAECLSRFLTAAVRAVVDVPPGMVVRVHVSETPKTWAVWHEH